MQHTCAPKCFLFVTQLGIPRVKTKPVRLRSQICTSKVQKQGNIQTWVK